MAKVEGPDHTFKLPSTVQRHLEHIAHHAAADAGIAAELPDMLGALDDILARLAETPVSATVTDDDGTTTTLVLGPDDVRYALASMLDRTRDLVQIPDVIHRMTRGDYSRVAEPALRLRRDSIVPAMTFMMDCASGATPARRARLEAEAADPRNVLGDLIDLPFPDLCSACGDPDLGDDFRGPIVSDVPVLFVSGDLDVRTPPQNVAEILPGFSRGVHVLVEGTGHDGREVLSPEFRELFGAFLRGEPVTGRTITLPGFQLMPLGFEMPAGR